MIKKILLPLILVCSMTGADTQLKCALEEALLQMYDDIDLYSAGEVRLAMQFTATWILHTLQDVDRGKITLTKEDEKYIKYITYLAFDVSNHWNMRHQMDDMFIM